MEKIPGIVSYAQQSTAASDAALVTTMYRKMRCSKKQQELGGTCLQLQQHAAQPGVVLGQLALGVCMLQLESFDLLHSRFVLRLHPTWNCQGSGNQQYGVSDPVCQGMVMSL